MPQTAEDILEFPQVLGLVRRHIASPLGLAELETLRPLGDRSPALSALADTAEAMEYLSVSERQSPPVSFQGLDDVRGAAARLGIEGAELEPTEIQRLLVLLERAGDLKSSLAVARARFPRLAAQGDGIAEFRPLLRDLAGKIQPDGRLEDHASGALRRIRREIEQQKRAVHESLERFVRAHSEEGSLQENYVTIRNDRLVVPVKSGQKRRIEGVVHAASSTGQTLFVEPLEAIELNNELVRLAEEELRETHRILREMTARLAHYADAISAAAETLGRLELLFAKAAFGREFACTVPSFSPADQPRLHLRDARHPLLEDLLRRRGSTAVPASITMDSDHRILIISGPNTGGKTVALKTVGLLALMAQAGLPAPAAEAEFPWFERVLADIGDYQSIQNSLSTFSAHIGAIRRMVEDATSGSLVLIDEMGAATDPQEGGALGVAVVDHFRRVGAFTLVSTHLPALKVYGVNTPGVISASLGFDEATLQPNYNLAVGLPGKSAGLDIAARLGIPAEIIAQAREALTSRDEEVASLIAELHRRVEGHQAAEEALDERRRQLERREKELQREWEKRETAKLNELERRVEGLLEKFGAEAKSAIDRITETAGGRKAASQAARRAGRVERELRDEFDATVLEALDRARQGADRPVRGAIQEGTVVRLRDVAAPARVRRLLGDDRFEVEVGLIKMQVSADEVLEIVPPQAGPPKAGPAGLPSNVTVHAASAASAASLAEINVIGATADEARERVDKFLDTAVLAATPRARIVHGHGMGVLRRALWEMFATHPHVERYYQAEQREGGAGATIVELKL